MNYDYFEKCFPTLQTRETQRNAKDAIIIGQKEENHF